MSILPTITPELVEQVAHKTYRLRLESDRDRATFDALPPARQKSLSVAYEPIVRAVLLAVGCPEPERKPRATAD